MTSPAEGNYEMNDLWRSKFLSRGWYRFHLSKKCGFAYVTTLKVASMTTRQMIDKKECGLDFRIASNDSNWKSCGDRECSASDLSDIASDRLLTAIFVRDPISRFESLYNYVVSTKFGTINNAQVMQWKLPFPITPASLISASMKKGI